MKIEVPPWVAAVIVIVVVLIVGAYLYFGTGPGRQAKEMEAAINAGVARPGSKRMGGGPPAAPGNAGNAPSGATAK